MSDMQSTEAPFTLVPFLEQVNYVGIFRDGFAVAECPGFRRAGIINRQGEWVLQPHFDSVKQGERYVARSGNDYMVVGVDGSVGQRKYQAIGGFNSGLSPAKIDGKYGVIDLEENEIVPFSHDNIGVFSCGLARTTDNGINGYINTAGQFAIPQIYANASNFNENLASIIPNDKRKWGIIDSTGAHVVPAIYDEIGKFVNGMALFRRGDVRGFLNSNYEEVFPGKFDDCGTFSPDGIAVYEIDDDYGIINASGRVICLPEYSYISAPSHGRLLCIKDHFPLFIDITGKVVIPQSYTLARGFSEGLAAVKRDGKWGYIDIDGLVKIDFNFSKAEDFLDGLAAVADERGKWGLIDKTGEFMVPPHYEDIDYCGEGVYCVKYGASKMLLCRSLR